MVKDSRPSRRLHLSKPQIAILALVSVLVLMAWGVIALLVVSGNSPTGISAEQLPKHKVASVMNDPFNMVRSEKYKRPWLQIVVADWRNFTESDVRLIGNYYLEQYPSAEFLTIDFMCDYSYTSEQEFLNVPDRLYNPHVLFRFDKKAYEDDGTPNGVTRYNRLWTQKDYPDFGTACK